MTEVDFKELYNKYSRSIFNYLFFLSGDDSLAKDLVQDTFLKVWERRNEIQMQSIKGLLYTIAKRLYLDKQKKKKVRFEFWRGRKSRHSNRDPQHQLEEKEFYELLINSIEKLPQEQKEVFLMNRIEKLKYREIAVRLDISIKTVEKRMSKALRAMHKIHTNI